MRRIISGERLVSMFDTLYAEDPLRFEMYGDEGVGGIEAGLQDLVRGEEEGASM